MKSAALAWGLLALALGPPALAGGAGIEIVGFGEQGASLRYVSGPEVTVRYRVRGLCRCPGSAPGSTRPCSRSGGCPAGEPMNVLLRRDDGATTVIADVQGDGALRTATVPVKTERWTLSEFEALAFEPATGTIHRARRRHGVVQTGPGSGSAATLQRASAALTEGFDADLVAGLDLDSGVAALE